MTIFFDLWFVPGRRAERTLIFFFVVVVFHSGVVEDVTEAALFAALALFSKGEYGEPKQPVQSVELNYNIAVHNGVVLTKRLATRTVDLV